MSRIERNYENYENCEKLQSYEKKSKCGAREVLTKTANFTKFTKIEKNCKVTKKPKCGVWEVLTKTAKFTKIVKNHKLTRKNPNVVSERSWRKLRNYEFYEKSQLQEKTQMWCERGLDENCEFYELQRYKKKPKCDLREKRKIPKLFNPGHKWPNGGYC